MKSFKNLAIMMLVAFVAMAGYAIAGQYNINEVRLNDKTLTSTGLEDVRAGDTVEIKVFLTGLADSPNTRIKASIDGYEYGMLSDVSDIFDVEAGVGYQRTLNIELPEDMEASSDYTLEIEVGNKDGVDTIVSYNLRVQEPRHLIRVFDAILNPTSSIQAGEPLFVTVRVENLGDKKEDQVKVTASIPALGIEVSQYVRDLITREQERNEDFWVFDEKVSDTTSDLLLQIPEDAKEGDYDVMVRVYYNRMHSMEEKVYKLHVTNPEAQAKATSKELINVNAQTQNVVAGEGVVYTFTLANLGEEARTFNLQVSGVQDWGSVRVDPQTVTVDADSTKEAFVFVAATENAEGVKTFMVKVTEGDKVVKEFTLTANVAGSGFGYGSLKEILQVAFLILLVILVVLGIVLIVKKSSEATSEEEAQSYY